MDFDFRKKDEEISNYDKILSRKEEKKKKEKAPLIVINADFDSLKMPTGFWAILIAIITLLAMSENVKDSEWGLFIALGILGQKTGFRVFALVALGLFGMYSHISGAGWLLFLALLV